MLKVISFPNNHSLNHQEVVAKWTPL